MASRPSIAQAAGTSRVRLGSVIKTARNIMRKDAGLNGDLDRLPLLSWLLFLRAFDAGEQERRIIEGEDFRAALSPSYQWHTWADDERLTGDALIKFINENLLPYLAGLKSDTPGDPRNVLGQVFSGIRNKMASGYLFRDLVNQVRKVDFTSSDDIHTMAYLYETLLKEVRDAAGDSGEFYTPRPVIRFVVEQSFPKLGESILDPACGTGGFLVEALTELTEGQDIGIAEQQRIWGNLRGIEKKSDPYLMCMMNLLLHGVPDPQIVHANALVRMLGEVGPTSKVDLVLTNPPFGGEEEHSVAARFPAGYQARETSVLFVKAIIDKLKPNGRCAIVLPNGFLFDDQSRKVREDLLTKCNLHTVVRLPQGVFEPYTKIPVNLLFFDRSGPTKEVWYYQIEPPEGRKGYAKTRFMRYEEFAECAAWWGGPERADRTESDRAWRVPAADIIANNLNLDIAPPTTGDDLARRSPTEILSALIAAEQEFLASLITFGDRWVKISSQLENDGSPSGKPFESAANATIAQDVESAAIGSILVSARVPVEIDPDEKYQAMGMRSFGKGIIRYEETKGSELSKLRYYRFPAGALALSNIKAWEGAIGITDIQDTVCVASNRFLFYIPRDDRINVSYLRHYLLSQQGLAQVSAASPGSADRNRTLSIKGFEAIKVPLPSLEQQCKIAEMLDESRQIDKISAERVAAIKEFREALLNAAFAGEL